MDILTIKNLDEFEELVEKVSREFNDWNSHKFKDKLETKILSAMQSGMVHDHVFIAYFKLSYELPVRTTRNKIITTTRAICQWLKTN